MRRVKRGEAVLIFPEGTRTSDGELGNIQAGFCTIARRSRAALIPVGVDGAFDVWPRQRVLPRFAPVAVHVGPPLLPVEIQEMDDEQLLAELHRRMLNCLLTARAQCSKPTPTQTA